MVLNLSIKQKRNNYNIYNYLCILLFYYLPLLVSDETFVIA